MVLTLVFIALVLSLYSVAHRHLAAQLRSETALEKIRHRDEGSLRALARGLALLETGAPSSSVYSCTTTVDTPEGTRTFTVTFTSAGMDSLGRPTWSVEAAPTTTSDTSGPMPASFATPTSYPRRRS